jgi:hypothetical protein
MRTNRRVQAALAAISLVVGFTFAVATPALAWAIDPIVPDCARNQGTAPPDLACVQKTFLNVAALIIAITGSFALLMFVYGGFTMLTSGGAADKVKQGQTIIRNAVIGIFLIFLAGYVIDYGKQALTHGSVKQTACSDPSLRSQGYDCMDPANGRNCNSGAVCGSKNEQCCMKPEYINLDNVPSEAPPDWLNNYMSNQ